VSPPPSPLNPSVSADESRWFAQEVHAHDAALKHYLRSSFPAIRDVEDIAQESYLRLWRQRAGDPIRSTRAFLFTIAQRVAIDTVRRLRRSPVDADVSLGDIEIVDQAPAGRESLSRRERIQLLIAAIDALPGRCREVVVLRKLKLVSQRDTATILGISEKGVEIQLARGLERCRDFLRRRGVTDFVGHDS
jgi:RNA polymerase sigma-70 factor (ECF subfamily)